MSSYIFAFESDNEDPSVTIDITVTDTDAAEELEVAETQVEAILNAGRQIEAAMVSLAKVETLVAKFGIQKPMLHAYNQKGALSQALGLSNLPFGESDEVINEPSTPFDAEPLKTELDVEEGDEETLRRVVVESISERLKSAKDAVVEFFKRLYERIKDFFAKYLGVTARLEKRLEKINSEIIKNLHKADQDHFAELKGSCMKATVLDKVKAFGMLTLQRDKNTNLDYDGIADNYCGDDKATMETAVADIKQQLEKNNLIEADVEVEGIERAITPQNDTTTKTYGRLVIKIKEKTDGIMEVHTDGKLSEHGWDIGTIRSGYQKCKDILKAAKNNAKIVRDIEKRMNELSKLTDKSTKANDKTRQSQFSVGLMNLKTETSAFVDVGMKENRARLRAVQQYCSIAERVKIKK